MFADRRRLLLGGAVVVVLGIALWLQLSPATPAATPAARARSSRQAAEREAAGPMQPVKLAVLAASTGREEPSETSRNPFRFQPKAAPPAPRPAPGAANGPDTGRPAAPLVPTGPPPLPPIPFKFIGIVTRENGEKWAVLSDGRVTVHGKDGDIIDGRYRIVKIGTESIELTYADGRGRQTVRLTGQ